MSTKLFCTFHLGKLYLGVEVLKVQEVIRYQQMTHVPLAPGAIRGLINLRGQIVTAVDLRRRLGLPDRADAELPMNVVLRSAEDPVSLLVDQIGDVVEVDERDFERPPLTLAADVREFMSGVYKLEGQLLLILDTERVAAISAVESSALSAK